MRHLLFTILIVLGAAFTAQAVTLQWGHDTPDEVVGYNIYYQPADQSAGPFKVTVNGGHTFTADIPDENFMPGVEFDLWATAFNEAGESDPCPKIQWTRPPYAPGADIGPDTVYIMPGKPSTLIILNN